MIAESPYLPPNAAFGCRYGLDPDSALLRHALTGTVGRVVDTAELAGDLEFLHRLLQRVWAAYPALLRHRTFEPAAFFAEWQARLHALGKTAPIRAALGEPLEALRRAAGDNHLQARGLDRPRHPMQEFQVEHAGAPPPAAAVAGPAGARLSTLRAAPLLRRDGALTTVLTLSAENSEPEIRLEAPAAGLRLVRRPPPPPAPTDTPAYAWRDVGGTAVLTLRTFSGRAPELRRMADHYPEQARHARIVLDLRGNGGGSLEYIEAWIARARAGEWRSHLRLEAAGALWPCADWNRAVCRQIVEGSVDTPEAAQERRRIRDAWSRAVPPPATLLLPVTRQGRARETYAGRVYAVVDRHSGSSGELAAYHLRRALGAVVVGERTAGAMGYGQLQTFVLPRSGLAVRVPTRQFLFEEYAEVEAVGLPVDVYLEDIGQPADALIRLLEALV